MFTTAIMAKAIRLKYILFKIRGDRTSKKVFFLFIILSFLLIYNLHTLVPKKAGDCKHSTTKKAQTPSIHYSGLALPLYTMVEPALVAHTPLCIGIALIFSFEVQVRVVN